MEWPAGCGRAAGQSAALDPLPDVEAGVLVAAAGVAAGLLSDELLEEALSDAVEVFRLSVR